MSQPRLGWVAESKIARVVTTVIVRTQILRNVQRRKHPLEIF
jgi:heme exporter protein D